MYSSRMPETTIGPAHYLARPGGRLAYEVLPAVGSRRGLILAVPGMGDLRSTYRHLVPALTAAGFRVVTTDLRGHGDSDATFDDYGDEATADDVTALVQALRADGERVVVMGSSMAAGSAVIAAARRPDLIDDLVLVGPFVREPDAGALARRVTLVAMRVVMAPAWAAASWKAFLPRLYRGARPADFDAHLAAIVASLRRPGYARALSRTTRTTHAPAEAALPAVRARVLVLMGTEDPDFRDPQTEARWVGAQVAGQVVLVDDAGHYPHAQRPDVVARAVLDFLAAGSGAGTGADRG